MLSGGEFDGALSRSPSTWDTRYPYLFDRLFPFHDDDLLHGEGSQEASQQTARSGRTVQGVSRDSPTTLTDRPLMAISTPSQHVL